MLGRRVFTILPENVCFRTEGTEPADFHDKIGMCINQDLRSLSHISMRLPPKGSWRFSDGR